MKILEKSYHQTAKGFEHTVQFEFEHRLFVVVVVEKSDEIFIQDAFHVIPKGNLVRIDMPLYFGAYADDVYRTIYDNIQRGFA